MTTFSKIKCANSTLSFLPDKVDLLWTDPPYGTAKLRKLDDNQYHDPNPKKALEDTVNAVRHVNFSDEAVLCICADYRIIHDVIVDLSRDFIFRGEIVWSFGLGRARTTWWPVRHNTIATFSVGHNPIFNHDMVPEQPRKAKKPGYMSDMKRAGSVWDKTMSNLDPERVGYPTQKPLDIVTPFILAHTEEGMTVADPFCGSGTTAHAALVTKRNFVGQDLNPQSVDVSTERVDSLEDND